MSQKYAVNIADFNDMRKQYVFIESLFYNFTRKN